MIENPEGVISLPTGKTPEYFIKQVNRFLTDWQSEKVRAELEAACVKKKSEWHEIEIPSVSDYEYHAKAQAALR
ncbi:MAG: hypothetical protein IIA58_04385 [Candidatus Marinimicrobia bacterium]|nr:hypothetical protein [Candidatus Neomarinimicrobiota bacterium]